jgi:hypothetical protein
MDKDLNIVEKIIPELAAGFNKPVNTLRIK